MISGAHIVFYSADADADREFFRDVLGDAFVDAGHGWLIFALPPAELAVHPAAANGQELFLMCDDVEGFIAEMTQRGMSCSAVQRERWGVVTGVTLPSGGTLRVYEPTHPTPLNALHTV